MEKVERGMICADCGQYFTYLEEERKEEESKELSKLKCPHCGKLQKIELKHKFQITEN